MKIQQHNQPFSLTTTNDSRLSNAGRRMRKLHIDEIPQLINVFLGQMSFVGPRPLPEPLYESYKNKIPFYDYRHVIKPGITGFAQIWQGYTNTIEEEALKWKYDIFYIQRLSFMVDIEILWQTIISSKTHNEINRLSIRNTILESIE